MADQGRNTATHQTNDSYDVFLSFCGPDTRHSFTGSLYHDLTRKGFKVFMDDQAMKPGDRISQTLVNAIRQSRISIVVLSQDYASSTWCLDELVEILECMRLKNQLVWPIFYKVAPSDVRHQRKSYAEAMAKHDKMFGKGSHEVQKWRTALTEVASVEGWLNTARQYDYELIEEIVKRARTKLQCGRLDVGEHIIGCQSRIVEVLSLLDIESCQTVCMLGIHGIGGMGKTTLAKALYNSIIHQFEYAIFLEDVREKSNSYMGLVHLQETILSKFEGENVKLSSASEGVTRLKDILQHQRVLLVLDDVDNEDQLENLARKSDWFGLGSRIIITTRDKHVLALHDVAERFEMKGLNDDEALQLFCLKAFKDTQPPMNYEKVSKRVVQYARGLPLALKVIGSHLCGKSVKACEDALQQYMKIPNTKIQQILKISYDCLEDPAKHIFLDIACFFKGKSLAYVEQVWEKCDFSPSYNVEILVDKSLITVEYGQLRMHDLIQDMGKKIVRLEDPKNPGRHSRLYFHQDVLKVLGENSGSDQIEGIMLDPPEEKKVNWNNNAFRKMTNLRILIIRITHFIPELDYLANSLKLLDWKGYPSKSLPLGCDQIVVLNLHDSHLTLEEAKPFQTLVHLTHFDFSSGQYITHLPDVSGVPNLSKLFLIGCRNLTAIHPSVGYLQKLEFLTANGCEKLEVFPPMMSLPSLQYLGLSSTSISFFPHIEERTCASLTIELAGSRIKKLPNSISKLTGLKAILIESKSITLEGLPSELFMLPEMEYMHLENCSVAVRKALRRLRKSHALSYSPLRELSCDNCRLTDDDLHIILCCFPNLQELKVPRNNFVSLPQSIEGSAKLKLLHVYECWMLEEIPKLPKSINEVIAVCCPLSLVAFKTLWSQVLNEAYGLYISTLITTNIPDWFDHHCEGGIVSFWARGKFPVLAVAFILNEGATIDEIQLHINGDLRETSYFPLGDTDSIYDLRRLFSVGEREILDTFRVHQWNHVVIECKCDLDYWLVDVDVNGNVNVKW